MPLRAVSRGGIRPFSVPPITKTHYQLPDSQLFCFSISVIAAITGGMLIQLPTSVDDGQRVTVELTIKDGLGYKKVIKFIIEKL